MYRHGIVALVGALLSLLPLVTAQCSEADDHWWTLKPSHVTELVACPTYTGNIDISELTGTIDLSGLEAIEGQLDCDVSDVAELDELTLRSTTLKRVSGSIFVLRRAEDAPIHDADGLGTLTVSLPKLESALSLSLGWGPGYIELETGPDLNITELISISGTSITIPSFFTEEGLRGLVSAGELSVGYVGFDLEPDGKTEYTLASPVRDVNRSVDVQNCVDLGVVEFGSLERVGTEFRVSDNPGLDRISASFSRAGSVVIEENGRNTSLALPKLETLLRTFTEDDVTSSVRHVVALEMPKLKEVTGTALEITENQFQSLSLPRLGIATGLTLRGNPLLSDLWIPRLATTDNLTVSGSPALLNFTANFLRRAKSITLSGSFTNVEMFNLEAVSGDFSVTGDVSMDCSWFDEHVRDAGVVKGTYSCDGNHTKPAVERKPSTPTSIPELQAWEAGQGIDINGDPIVEGDGGNDKDDEAAGSGGLSTGAQAGIGVGVSLGVVTCAAVAWLLFRRKARAKRKSGGQFQKAELDGGDTEVPLPYPQELLVEDKPVEIGADTPMELPTEFPTRPLTPPAELSAEPMEKPGELMSKEQPAELVSPEEPRHPRQPRPTRQPTLDGLVSPL